jgi:hypothetical protein
MRSFFGKPFKGVVNLLQFLPVHSLGIFDMEGYAKFIKILFVIARLVNLIDARNFGLSCLL